MGKMLLSVFFGLAIVMAASSATLAHHAGGVEIGDLESGSVVGQPFKELTVDQELFAMELGTAKVWYPPTVVIDFKGRTGRPVVFKVTNSSTADHGFMMSSDESFGAPSALKVQLVLKPGETKYIGIPTSDLFYSGGATIYFKCHLHPAHIGGKFVMIK